MLWLFLTIGIFALNLYISWRLLFVTWLPHFGSVEGFFIAIARLAQTDGWWPFWYGGLPFSTLYVPLLHVTAAATARLTGLEPAHAYHVVTGLAYAAGPAALVILARTIGLSRLAGLCSGLCATLFSASALYMPNGASDIGGFWNARRLQVLTVYGEGPHVASLFLQCLALAAFHWTFQKPTPRRIALTAGCLAAVIAMNIPGTMALVAALACAIAARPEGLTWKSIVAPGVLGYGLAAAAVPPAMIATIFRTSRSMHPGVGMSLAWAAAICGVAFALWLAGRVFSRLGVTFGARFACLWCALLALVSGTAVSDKFELLPQGGRLHLEAEFAAALVFGAAIAWAWPRASGQVRDLIVIALVTATLLQVHNFKTYAGLLIRPADVTTRSEWRTAQWLTQKQPGAKVYATGSQSFWLNAWADNPQFSGCCDQSLDQQFKGTIAYVVNLAETPQEIERGLMWLRAHGVQSIIASGPESTEIYKDMRRPAKFKPYLPALYEAQGDIVYALAPPGELAYRVPASAVVRTQPANFLDTAATANYVQTRQPLTFRNLGRTIGRVEADRLEAGDRVSVLINHHAGWHAMINGREAGVTGDGLGHLLIEPGACAPCSIDLTWRPLVTDRLVQLGSAAAWVVLIWLVWLGRR